MFPPPTTRRPNKRSLRELVRDAVETAFEFATLADAPTTVQPQRPGPARPAPHPHRRPLSRRPRARRPNPVRPRAQVCTTPLEQRRRAVEH